MDQPKQLKDTEWSIMKGYGVIHNKMVQGDHYFWTNIFGTKDFFQCKIIWDINFVDLDPTFYWPLVFLIFGPKTFSWPNFFCWTRKNLLDPNFWIQIVFGPYSFWNLQLFWRLILDFVWPTKFSTQWFFLSKICLNQTRLDPQIWWTQ